MGPANGTNPKKGLNWVLHLVELGVICAVIGVLILPLLLRQSQPVYEQQQSITLQGNKLIMEGIEPGEVDLSPLLADFKKQLDEKNSAVTTVYNSYSIIQNSPSNSVQPSSATTDSQTLSLSGNVLTISGGNSVSLPAFSEQDGVIGNEVTDVGVGSGLLRTGSGTTLDPFKVSLQTCADGEILKNSGGTSWSCAADAGGASYNAGSGLQLVGATFSINSPTCAGTAKLQWTGSAFICAADIDTDTNTTYTAGNGLQLIGTNFSVNSPTCAGTTKLQWTGSAFACSIDIDTNTDAQTLSWVDGTRTLSISNGNSVVIPDTNTTYSALTNGGLRLVGTQFGLAVCSSGQILKAQPTSGEYACASDTDTNTTYSAGTGLSLVGTTFANTGTLSVTGSGAVTSSGGQNPTIAFANGSAVGQFWQWDGDSWELVTLAAEQDAAIGNEVVNVTGSNSGLVRSGSGTAVSPYTLAANVGNGLQIVSNAIAINSPTCSGTDKLQWTGSAFTCNPDVDTDTNTTYTASNGLQLISTAFSVNSPTCAGTTKLQWTGTAFVCSADVDTNTDAQTLTWVDGTRTLSISGGNSVVIPDANTTYSTLANGGLRLVGTQFALKVCTSGQVLKAQATSGEWDCAADIDTDTNTTYSAGTGLSLVGTTFNNTGTLTVTASGALTSSGGQNPDIAFANGSATGQFWQWDGDSWELATLAAEQDAVIGNEIVNVTGSNSGLVRSGSGTSVSPYTVAANVGNGLQIVSNAIAINSPTCAGTDKLQWTGTAFTCTTDVDTNTTYTAGDGISIVGSVISTNSPTCTGTDKLQWTGTAFVCSTDSDGQTLSWNSGTRTLSISGGNSVVIPDADTTYSALTSGGLRLVGTEFGLKVCTSGQVLKAQATSGEWDCAADLDTDTNTTYSAGTGLSLVGTTFNNTGVLTVTASGALTSSGGQNPDIAFANGSVNGQFWQWDGDSWELATLPTEQDAVIGNEVTNVTGSNSGLVRSGSGTAVSPYTLAANVGNGLQIVSNAIGINSPTCSGTDKLQWSGTAFVCATDVDTNTTYSTISNGGVRLVGTQFGLVICTNGQVLKATAVSGEYACGTDNNTTYSAGTGLSLVTTTFNLANTTVSANSYGSQSTTSIPTFTVDAQGRLTAAGSYSLSGSGAISVSSGTISCATCVTSVSLQTAYTGGNTITTTDNRSISFSMADTTTDSNFLVDLQCDTSCSTNGRFAVQDDGVDVLKVSPAGGAFTHQVTADNTSAFRILSSTGVPYFNVDTSNALISIGFTDTTGALLILDHKTTSGDPAGFNGGMYYNANSSKFRCYEGSNWYDCVTRPLLSRFYGNANQSITSGVEMAVEFPVSGNNESGVTVAANSTFTVTKAGLWQLSTNVRTNSNGSNNQRYIAIADADTGDRYAQSSVYPGTSVTHTSLSASATVRLSANARLQVLVFQDSGIALATIPFGNGTNFSLTWIGP